MSRPEVLVIGGSNLDIIGTSLQTLIPGDSNPGSIKRSAGGVGRNITENLARLGLPVSFITVLGEDRTGRRLLNTLEQLDVDMVVKTTDKTSIYMAICAPDGQTETAISDMKIMDALNSDFLREHQTKIEGAEIVVVDPNLDEVALDFVFKHASRVFVDGVSTSKTVKLKPFLHRIDTLKLNRLELEALSEPDEGTREFEAKAIQDLLSQGVKRVALTLGDKGAKLITPKGELYREPIHIPIINTTGAGDAFMAGLIYAEKRSLPALKTAMTLAEITIEAKSAVNPDLTADMLLERIK